MRKNVWFLVIALAAILFYGSCAHMTVPKAGLSDMHCPGGHGGSNPNGPIICIDANTLNADPDHQPVHRGAWIHFYMTDSSQELDIVFKESAKVQYKGKNLNEVWVRVKDDAELGATKYTAINVTSGNSKDPEIVIEP